MQLRAIPKCKFLSIYIISADMSNLAIYIHDNLAFLHQLLHSSLAKILESLKQQSIKRTTEFEHADMSGENMVDATPCPHFTPKNRKSTHIQRSHDTEILTNDEVESNFFEHIMDHLF
jgi:hypothetical protein